MQLPTFLLADNSESPNDVFIIHTAYPIFLINLKNDEVTCWEEVTEQNQTVIMEEIQKLIKEAYSFYDNEMDKLK